MPAIETLDLFQTDLCEGSLGPCAKRIYMVAERYLKRTACGTESGWRLAVGGIDVQGLIWGGVLNGFLEVRK